MKGRATAVATLMVFWSMAGCERESLPWVCPELPEGSLVVSEIRGPQSGDVDGYGQWIELYNQSGQTVTLEGLHVSVRKLDGSGEAAIMVRARDVTVAPGAYTVLGDASPGAEPPHVDYGYLLDFGGNLYDSAAIDVVACGVLLDQVVYRNLPSTGTWALDGSEAPSAANNDMETAWCLDTAADPQTPTAGIRGTPGQPNPECPP